MTSQAFTLLDRFIHHLKNEHARLKHLNVESLKKTHKEITQMLKGKQPCKN